MTVSVSPVSEERTRNSIARNLVELLISRAQEQPDRVAYTFVAQDGAEELSVTYEELDQKARKIAAAIRTRELSGAHVLLVYPFGLEYVAAFFGCLYAGAVAVPAYPPRSNRNVTRLRSIIVDAQARLILTTETLRSRLESLLGEECDLECLITPGIDDRLAEDWTPDPIDGDSVCLLQYTSGSTSIPRGVLVTHSNLLHNEALIAEAFEQRPESVIVSWLPLYHDMGLIGGVLQPLYLGARCILFSPLSFLQRPSLWLELITRYRATTSGGPNFAYDLCLRKIPAEARATFDLRSWQVAFNGAEPVRQETLERFAEAFAPAGFRQEVFFPCYGLAEATLLVSGGKAKDAAPVIKPLQSSELERNRVVEGRPDEGLRYLASCGIHARGQKVVVVNPETLFECPRGEIGEVWVAGPSVALGYWNQPDLTAQTFRAYLSGTGAGPFLRTGDLGFVDDGELFITGRLKDLVIVRGLNYYPQDIELVAEHCHPSLRAGCGAAFTADVEGAEELVVVYEVDRRRTVEIDKVLVAIHEAIAEELELQVSTVLLTTTGSIPKTSSGKIQRSLCREMFLAGELKTVGAWSARSGPGAVAGADDVESIEEWLIKQLAQRLGVERSSIDVEQPIVRYGIDSLAAVELAHLIESRFGIVVPMVRFLQDSSVRELATFARSQPEGPEFSAEDFQHSEQPLSSGQQSLWFMQKLAPESTAYNLARAFRVRSRLDQEALRRALKKLVARHAALRTTFHESHGRPVQRIHEFAEISFHELDALSMSELAFQERLTEETKKPFNLETGPLLHVTLFRRAHDEHVLLIVIHHIVSDFWSFALVMKELSALYAAEVNGQVAKLDPLHGQYAEYVASQTDFIVNGRGRCCEEYWQQQLSGELPRLNLPGANPRPAFKTFAGRSALLKFDADFGARVKALSKEYGATPYMILLAGFYTLLHRLTGEHDLIVGTLTSGRSRPQFAGNVGYFVNPLPLRADLSGQPTFAGVMQRMRALVLSAFEHQDWPFPQLVNQVQPQRDPARSPIFDVVFVLQKTQLLDDQDLSAFALEQPGAQLELNGLRLETVPLESCTAQFDLMLLMAETEAGIVGRLEYNSDLYEPEVIERMRAQYERLLREAVSAPSHRVSQLPLLGEAEKQQLLVNWNPGGAAPNQGRTLNEMFWAQAQRTPEAVAVRGRNGEGLSYAALETQARVVAEYLRRQGIGPEQLVGVCLQRTPQLLVGLLGILEAGAAYVPLDPHYPSERLRWMLADAGAKWVLTEEALMETVRAIGSESESINLDALLSGLPEPAAEGASGVAPANLAYVLYTSGSTGRPKGVMLTHESAVALLGWAHEQYDAAELSAVLASTSICFDLSIFELFVPLTCGGTVVLVENVLELGELRGRDEVRLINTVPSAMKELLRLHGASGSVQVVNLAGETLDGGLVGEIYEQLPHVKAVWNLYGPTEDTTYSTGGVVERGTARPNIGRVLAGERLYIVDAQQQLRPIGATGEVVLGGVGLARGYLGRPEMTAERFVPDGISGEAGARLYRTGDLGRYQRDGAVEFLGRMDQQMKLRGFRIELEEIESALLGHDWVSEAAVVAQTVIKEQRLVAYVALTGAVDRSVSEVTEELQGHLSGLLPEFMLPAALLVLPALPRTPNGKLDRKQLPPVTEWGAPHTPDASLPLNPVEQLVAEIWSEVLGRSVVGAEDNFFALGGHSLLATQVLSRLRETFAVDLPLRVMFEAPVLSALARTVQERLNGEQASRKSAETVKRASRDLYRVKLTGTEQLTLPESVKRFL
ncbi:MAG TPA: amino acid adenylation domain-containing protein [Pyrinomonadaceae bacterium]|jgi:amino acid adenylation domain-containing protein|nr:amino acid adenylation domain-containing protein [Pyrinomonadaceae bacterium]